MGAGDGFKCVEGVCGQETRPPGVTDPPAPVDQDAALAARAGEEVGRGLAGAHDFHGCGGLLDAGMDDIEGV
jgi:hypothetical protein